MHKLREWWLPIALITAWWLTLVYTLTLLLGPTLEPARRAPSRPVTEQPALPPS
jgi:hypothetical protein